MSYTRISSYMECKAKYYYRYVNKPSNIHIPLEDFFLKGNLAHSCIEEYLLKGAEKDDIIDIVLPTWLREKCLLPVARDYDESMSLSGIDAGDVINYAKRYGQLLHRCTAKYQEEDRIRNKDGTIPKDPVKYPPLPMQQAYNQQGLPDLKMSIDNMAAMLNNEFRRIGLANMAAEAVACFYNFDLPDWVEEITGIEYTSEEKIPWDDGTKEWMWFVDLKYKTTDGAKIISDHKTSSSKPTDLEVAFHPQLNLYAYLELQETGSLPDYISINHLPTGDFINAEVDPTVVMENIKHLEEVQKAINISTENNSFPGHTPTEFNSPCIKRDWKTQEVTRVCPYITLCHPRYVEYVKHEIADYLNLE